MKFYDMVRLANASLWRNKSRTFLTVLAIFIGAFTIIMTSGINTGVNSYIDKQVNSVGAEDLLEISPKSMSSQMQSLMSGSNDVQEYSPSNGQVAMETLDDEDLQKIKDTEGIKSAKYYQIASADYIASSSSDKKYQVRVSVQPTDTVKLDLAAGSKLDMNSDTAEMILPDKYVKPLGFSSNEDAVGKTIKLGVTEQLSGKVKEVAVKVVGVQNASVVGMGASWINDKTAQLINDVVQTGLPAEYSSKHYAIIAQVDSDYVDNSNTDKLKDKLDEMGYSAMTLTDAVSMIKTFFTAITTVLSIFGAIALVAASIGIINTLFMSVQERTREIGLMKAMGLGGGKIFGMFSLEAISLGFWGGLLAVVVAYLAKAIVNPLANQTFLSGLPGFTLIEFNPLTLVIIVAVVMVIAFLAGTLPARRAAKKDPIEALRYE